MNNEKKLMDTICYPVTCLQQEYAPLKDECHNDFISEMGSDPISVPSSILAILLIFVKMGMYFALLTLMTAIWFTLLSPFALIFDSICKPAQWIGLIAPYQSYSSYLVHSMGFASAIPNLVAASVNWSQWSVKMFKDYASPWIARELVALPTAQEATAIPTEIPTEIPTAIRVRAVIEQEDLRSDTDVALQPLQERAAPRQAEPSFLSTLQGVYALFTTPIKDLFWIQVRAFLNPPPRPVRARTERGSGLPGPVRARTARGTGLSRPERPAKAMWKRWAVAGAVGTYGALMYGSLYGIVRPLSYIHDFFGRTTECQDAFHAGIHFQGDLNAIAAHTTYCAAERSLAPEGANIEDTPLGLALNTMNEVRLENPVYTLLARGAHSVSQHVYSGTRAIVQRTPGVAVEQVELRAQQASILTGICLLGPFAATLSYRLLMERASWTHGGAFVLAMIPPAILCQYGDRLLDLYPQSPVGNLSCVVRQPLNPMPRTSVLARMSGDLIATGAGFLGLRGLAITLGQRGIGTATLLSMAYSNFTTPSTSRKMALERFALQAIMGMGMMRLEFGSYNTINVIGALGLSEFAKYMRQSRRDLMDSEPVQDSLTALTFDSTQSRASRLYRLIEHKVQESFFPETNPDVSYSDYQGLAHMSVIMTMLIVGSQRAALQPLVNLGPQMLVIGGSALIAANSKDLNNAIQSPYVSKSRVESFAALMIALFFLSGLTGSFGNSLSQFVAATFMVGVIGSYFTPTLRQTAMRDVVESIPQATVSTISAVFGVRSFFMGCNADRLMVWNATAPVRQACSSGLEWLDRAITVPHSERLLEETVSPRARF